MEQRENWLNAELPGSGDIIRMDKGQSADQAIEVALLDGKLSVARFYLAQNGLLFFGKFCEFGGERAEWQFESSPETKEAIFLPENDIPNFFDWKNWHTEANSEGTEEGNRETVLDAERVPCAEDEVHLPGESASKVFIDVPAVVRSFNLSGQLLSDHQLRLLPFSIESQFLFRIGSRLGWDVSVDGKYQLRRPTKRPLSLSKEKTAKEQEKATFFGRPNSNLFEPQFSELCKFVQCPASGLYCDNPIKPFGECCAQCGALLKFRQNTLNHTHSRAIVRQLVHDWRTDQLLPVGAGLSFVRIDQDDFHPLYQLTVLGSVSSDYQESLFCSLLWAAFRRIQQRGVNAHLAQVDYTPSRGHDYFDMQAQCSPQKGILRFSVLFKWIFLCAAVISILVFAFLMEYKRNARLRLIVDNFLRPSGTDRRQSFLRVYWQRGTTAQQVDLAGLASQSTLSQNRSLPAAQTTTVTGALLIEFVNRAFRWRQMSETAVGRQEEAKGSIWEGDKQEKEEELDGTNNSIW